MARGTAVGSYDFGDGWNWFWKIVAWAGTAKVGYEVLMKIIAFVKRKFG